MSISGIWRALSCALLLGVISTAHAAPMLPTEALRTLPKLERVGEGELKFFGFRVYSAALWRANSGDTDLPTLALELTYHREIAREQLVTRSIEEIRRLHQGTPQRLSAWAAQLHQVLRDVAPGDRLIGIRHADGSATFYTPTSVTGHITDGVLAQAFFDIWLHPQTSEPALRAALLGQNRQ